MKKRNIFIILGVIILLVAVYAFAVNYTPAEEPAPSATPAAESIVVFETDSSLINKITFHTSTPFTLVKNNDVWKIEGNSAEILQSSALSITYSASYISAVSKIEKSDDISVFGLDNPSAAVTVDYGSESVKMLLGDKTPTGNYYYFKLDGDSSVYSISEYTADIFFKTPSSVRDLSVISISAEEITEVEISSPAENLKVSQNAEAEGADEKSYASLSKWIVTSPYTQIASADRVSENLLTPLSSITAEAVAEDNPASLSKYNLNTSISVKTADKNYNFKAGAANGVNYLYDTDKNIVYTVLKTNLAFLDVKAFDIIQRLITFPNIADLKSVAVSYPSVSATLSREEKSEEDVSYFVDGKASSEEAFKSMYQQIMGLTVDGALTKSFSRSSALCTILYTLENGSEEKLQFYSYDDLNVAVVRNSKATFYMKKTKLTELENALKAYIKDPNKKLQ